MEVSVVPPRKTKRRFRPRTWRGWLGLAAILFLVFAGVCVLLYRATPPWYEPLDVSQVWVIDSGDVGRIKLGYLTGISLRGQQADEVWEITQDEINAAYATLPAKPTNPLFSDPVFAFTPGKVTISGRSSKLFSMNPHGEIVSLVFSVSMIAGSDGQQVGEVKLSSAWAGLLPAPGWSARGQLRALEPMLAKLLPKISEIEAHRHEARDIVTYLTAVVGATLEDKPFSLEMDGINHVVIKSVEVQQGKFRMVVGRAGGAIANVR